MTSAVFVLHYDEWSSTVCAQSLFCFRKAIAFTSCIVNYFDNPIRMYTVLAGIGHWADAISLLASFRNQNHNCEYNAAFCANINITVNMWDMSLQL